MHQEQKCVNKETDLALKFIIDIFNEKYGYDFREYSISSFRRRVEDLADRNSMNNISELIPRLLYSKEFFRKSLSFLTVGTTEMFRNPVFYQEIIKKVIPFLETFPFSKIWIAGCSTGEEVYSISILLNKVGLKDRFMIYATDINKDALVKAERGVYDIDKLERYQTNFIHVFRDEQLLDHFSKVNKTAKINDKYKKNLVFSRHNLVCDSSFGEMQFVICRNVLIYFKNNLQNRVLNLFYDTMGKDSYLGIGESESVKFSSVEKKIKLISEYGKIYKK